MVVSFVQNTVLTKMLKSRIWSPGPGCIKPTFKCPLKQVRVRVDTNTYESVMGTLTGVAWNALSTLSVLRGNLRAHVTLI